MKHERRNHLKTLGGCLKDLDHLSDSRCNSAAFGKKVLTADGKIL